MSPSVRAAAQALQSFKRRMSRGLSPEAMSLEMSSTRPITAPEPSMIEVAEPPRDLFRYCDTAAGVMPILPAASAFRIPYFSTSSLVISSLSDGRIYCTTIMQGGFNVT